MLLSLRDLTLVSCTSDKLLKDLCTIFSKIFCKASVFAMPSLDEIEWRELI